jgi:hypothetical protein
VSASDKTKGGRTSSLFTGESLEELIFSPERRANTCLLKTHLGPSQFSDLFQIFNKLLWIQILKAFFDWGAGLFGKKSLTRSLFCNRKEQHETVGVRGVRIVGGDSALF